MALGAIGVAALALRLVYVISFAPDQLPLSDGFFYHAQANLVARGGGFADPLLLAFRGINRSSAGHPPLFVLVLSVVSWFGGTSIFAHQITESFLEAFAVVAIGCLGREVAGKRVGVIAALVAAIYPVLWVNEGEVLSESLYGLVIAMMLLAAYRFWHRPGWMTGLLLGLATGLAALCRGEGVLFLPLLVLPLALMLRSLTMRRRLVLLAVAAVGALVVIGPWTAFNLARFNQPVLISTNQGVVIAGANCDSVYSGRLIGGWDPACTTDVGPPAPGRDESDEAATQQHRGITYARNHLHRLPAVVTARIARTWQFFRPVTDAQVGGRVTGWMRLLVYYLILPLAAGGAFILFRRPDIPVFPLLATALEVTVAVALTWGATRFRLPADVAFIVLAAVALNWFSERGRSSDARSAAAQRPGTPPLSTTRLDSGLPNSSRRAQPS